MARPVCRATVINKTHRDRPTSSLPPACQTAALKDVCQRRPAPGDAAGARVVHPATSGVFRNSVTGRAKRGGEDGSPSARRVRWGMRATHPEAENQHCTTRLHSNLRPTTRECVHVVTRSHFRSRDKDGGHIIRPAVAENPMLHANFPVLCFIEAELLLIEVLRHFYAPMTLTLTR